MQNSAFLLKIGSGSAPPQFATIAGLRTQKLTLEKGRAWITAHGVFTGSAAETRLKANALSGAIDDYRMVFESGEQMQGKFLVTRLDYSGDFNGQRSYTISLESSGEVLSS